MKKLMVLAISVTTAFASCKKSDALTTGETTTTEDVVNVTLASNESFKYQLSSDDAAISSDASHASLSRVSVVPGSATVFEYLPDSTFSGTDVVTVTFTPTNSNSCGGHHGPPPQHPDSLNHHPGSLHHGGCHHGPPPPPADSTGHCGGHHPHKVGHGKKDCKGGDDGNSSPAIRKITFKFTVGAAGSGAATAN